MFKMTTTSDKENEPLSPKFRAGILGATGSVGQRFCALLNKHPWIEVVAVGASERSAGKKYKNACQWRLTDTPMPKEIGELIVLDAVKDETKFIEMCDIVFSALSASLAKTVEATLASAGLAVFSNASTHRYDPLVPILIPQVNWNQLEIVRQQSTYLNGGGFIVTNSNCSCAGLCVALKPLDMAFGIEKVFVTTLQAVSGAGYPGLSYWEIHNNVIPFIQGEEQKIQEEPRKILGHLVDNKVIEPHDLIISSSVNRVAVLDGHMLVVSVKFKKAVDKRIVVTEVEKAFESFNSDGGCPDLPSMPEQYIRILKKEDEPQPQRNVNEGKGMTVTVGRIRPCEILDVKFVALSHNTVIGAAGGSIVNAELAVARGILR